MKKIVVTGATGDIGSQIALYLAKNKYDVWALVQDNEISRNKFEKIFRNTAVKAINCDIASIDTLKGHLKNIDCVIHAAGLLRNKVEKQGFENALFTNSLISSLLATIAGKKQTVIYISTDSVYDIPQAADMERCIDELKDYMANLTRKLTSEHSFNQIEVVKSIKDWVAKQGLTHIEWYGISKYLGELLIQIFSEKHVICRLTNIFGPGYSLKRTIPKIIYNRLKGDVIHIPNKNRNYIYVQDINHMIRHFVDNDDIRNVTFNLDSQKYITTRELVKKINFYTPTFYGIASIINESTDDKRLPGLLKKSDFPYLKDIYKKPLSSFEEGIRNTIYYVGDSIVRQMENSHSIDFFVGKNEKIVRTMFGSSSAQVLLIENIKSTNKVIRKIALRKGVEGNGYPKLRSEHDYLLKIRNTHPDLYKLYPQVQGSRNMGNAYSLDYQYIKGGMNVYKALITKQIPPGVFLSMFEKLFDQALIHGYLTKSAPLNKLDSFREENNYYLHRASYRINSIAQNRYKIDFVTLGEFSFGKLLKQNSIIINNKEYINAPKLVNIINGRSDFREYLRVKKNNFCVHGDLTFLNMLYDSENSKFVLIDPRGHYGLWDYHYDLGKLLFTLNGFGNIIESRYSVSQNASGDFELHLSDITEAGSPVNTVKELIINYFKTNVHMKALTHDDENWLDKVDLAAATHFLADIPYRLFIDKSPKNAFACYLAGTIYLNDIYDKIKKSLS